MAKKKLEILGWVILFKATGRIITEISKGGVLSAGYEPGLVFWTKQDAEEAIRKDEFSDRKSYCIRGVRYVD